MATDAEVREIARQTRGHTFDALTMDEHTDLVRAVLEAAAKARPSDVRTYEDAVRAIVAAADTWNGSQDQAAFDELSKAIGLCRALLNTGGGNGK